MSKPSPTFVWHPFLLALYPILLIYSRNDESIYFSETVGALIFVSLATLTSWAIVRRLWDDPAHAGLVVSAVLFVIFSFERNVHMAEVRGWGATPSTREWQVLSAELLLLGMWLLILRRWPVSCRPLNTMANAGSIALLGFLVPGMVTTARTTPTYQSPSTNMATASTRPPARGVSSADRPDIYFLVLDAYGRSDVLKSMFDLDNQGFLARMEQLGFYVARQSTANYCQTALSISATLNGSYHDRLVGSSSRSRLPLRDLIRDNEFASILGSHGYKMVSFASGFGLTDGFPAANRLAPRFDISEFNALVLDMTPIWTILGQGAGQASHQHHRERIDYLFDHLADVASDPEPTFCLAHVLAPHPPFVFDRQGRDISGQTSSYRLTDGKLWSSLDGHGGPSDYASHYRDQAIYITNRVEQAVKQILARSTTQPVIIIQGDHGPGLHFDTDDVHPNDLFERMSILNLCLLPSGGAAQLYPSITPVNIFRVVSDQLFETDRGTIPDRNFYSSYQSPYQTIEVTRELTGPQTGARPKVASAVH